LRGEFEGNDHLQFDLNQYFYALDQVIVYLNENVRQFSEQDARVYAFYIEQTHDKFAKIAMEYDCEYTAP
jgi:hypothetical protein